MKTLQTNRPSALRAPAVWLSTLLIVYLFFNVGQALFAPGAFADRFGTPVNGDDTAFIHVYAVRTFFIALFGLLLLVRRAYGTLALLLLVAIVMPLGDALIVAAHGGLPTIIVRHVVIAVVVASTGWWLQRWAQTAR